MLKRAEILDEVDSALDPRPLRPEELGGEGGEGFYVDTVKVRDPSSRFRARLAKLLSRDEERVKVMIYGHTGSGKSTELVKFQKDNDAKFRFVTMSLAKEGLLATITPASLLLFIFDQAIQYCKKAEIPIDEKLAKSVLDWFKKTVEIDESEITAAASAEVEVQAKAPLFSPLAWVSSRLKGETKTRGSRFEKAVQEKPQLIYDLAERTGLILKAIETGLPKEDERKVVLVIEDLDKLTFRAAKEVFLEEPAILGDLPCRLILLAPISLTCTPKAHQLDTYYTRVPFPMIHVLNKSGKRDEDGVAVVREIVRRRVSSDLISDDDIDHAAEMTGGIIRSLFEALILSAEVTLAAIENDEHTTGRIGRKQVEYGLAQVRKTLEARISIVGLDREFVEVNKVSVEALKGRLSDINNGSVSGVPDPLDAILMEAQALIEYNGEGYRCVNPLLRASLGNAG